MSTTIKYKGATIATAENQTKTLQTAGKYMEADVVIEDVTQGGTGAVSVVDTQDSHGGIVRTITARDISDTTAEAEDVRQGKYFYTAAGVRTEGTASGGGGGDSWSWMGKNPTKVSNYTKTKAYLKDTGYATWTPSTSSTTIAQSAELSQISISDDYDYVVFWQFHSHFEYINSSGTAEVEDVYWACAVEIFRYPGALSNMTAGTNNYGGSENYSQAKGMFYKDMSGNEMYSTSNTFGVYTNSIPSITQYADRIIPKTPAILARCNAAYFSTDSAAAVDQNESYYELSTQVWRVDAHTSGQGALINNIREMWLNGL